MRPTDIAPITTWLNESTGEIEEGFAWWTLVPGWLKDKTKAQSNFNARLETLLEKPSFTDAFQYRRCLVPALSFHEWSGTKRHRIRHEIKLESHRTMYMAGLYEPWYESVMGEPPRETARPDNAIDAKDRFLGTFTIITVGANRTMSAIHDRMPLLLSKAQRVLWLDRSISPGELSNQMLRQHQDRYEDQSLTIDPPLLFM